MSPIASAVFSLALGFVFLFLVALPALLVLLLAGLQWTLARRGRLLILPLVTGALFLDSLHACYPRPSSLAESCFLFWSAGAFAGTMLGWLLALLGRLIRQLREF